MLLVCLFLPWFGVTVGEAPFRLSVTVDGLATHGYLYVVLALCLTIVLYTVARSGWGELPLGRSVHHPLVMLGLTAANLVLTVIAFASKPGGIGIGWRYGAVVALLASVAACLPWARSALER